MRGRLPKAALPVWTPQGYQVLGADTDGEMALSRFGDLILESNFPLGIPAVCGGKPDAFFGFLLRESLSLHLILGITITF